MVARGESGDGDGDSDGESWDQGESESDMGVSSMPPAPRLVISIHLHPFRSIFVLT